MSGDYIHLLGGCGYCLVQTVCNEMRDEVNALIANIEHTMETKLRERMETVELFTVIIYC